MRGLHETQVDEVATRLARVLAATSTVIVPSGPTTGTERIQSCRSHQARLARYQSTVAASPSAKRGRRGEAELRADLRRRRRGASELARAVGRVLDQLADSRPTSRTTSCASVSTSVAIAGADVEHLAPHGVERGLEHALDRVAGVVDEDPVARRPSVAVDGQRIAAQRARDEARQQLLEVLAGTVVVEGPHDHGGQRVGLDEGVDQPVGGALGGGVRRVRLERMVLVHRVVQRRAVDLRRGHVHEALEAGAHAPPPAPPASACPARPSRRRSSCR